MISHVDSFRLLTLPLLAVMTSCSSMQTAQQPPPVSGANPSQATVYFYRLHSSPGSVVGVDLKDNGIDIGTVQDGTYFVYHANPGVHALTATTDTASTQNFKLQAGATYYIKALVVPRPVSLTKDWNLITRPVLCQILFPRGDASNLFLGFNAERKTKGISLLWLAGG